VAYQALFLTFGEQENRIVGSVWLTMVIMRWPFVFWSYGHDEKSKNQPRND
jgi:hypothetical protein